MGLGLVPAHSTRGRGQRERSCGVGTSPSYGLVEVSRWLYGSGVTGTHGLRGARLHRVGPAGEGDLEPPAGCQSRLLDGSAAHRAPWVAARNTCMRSQGTPSRPGRALVSGPEPSGHALHPQGRGPRRRTPTENVAAAGSSVEGAGKGCCQHPRRGQRPWRRPTESPPCSLEGGGRAGPRGFPYTDVWPKCLYSNTLRVGRPGPRRILRQGVDG